MRAPAGRLTSKTAPQRNARGVTVAGRSSRAPRGNTVNTAGATAGLPDELAYPYRIKQTAIAETMRYPINIMTKCLRLNTMK